MKGLPQAYGSVKKDGMCQEFSMEFQQINLYLVP